MTDNRPLVLLDVDGVVNALEPHVVATQRHQADGYTLEIPDYLPSLVAHLTTVAEVWWCTTWRHAANLHISPLLGIGSLPVVDDGSESRYVEWKAAAAKPLVESALAAGRAVVWVEDFYGYPPVAELPPGVQFVDTTVDDSFVLRPEHLPPFLLDGWEPSLESAG
jgi:hypothetical protein